MTQGQNPDDPDTAKSADSKRRYDHGNDCISDTAQSTGQYFDVGIYKVEYTQEMHHICSNCNNSRVIHKERNTPGTQYIDTETADNGKDKTHPFRGSDAFVNAFHFSGTDQKEYRNPKTVSSIRTGNNPLYHAVHVKPDRH